MHPVHLQPKCLWTGACPRYILYEKSSFTCFWKRASLDVFKLAFNSGEQVKGYGQALLGVLHDSPSFYIHAFSRHFHPKQLTLNLRCMSLQSLHSLGIVYMTLALPVACSTILTTARQINYFSLFPSLFCSFVIHHCSQIDSHLFLFGLHHSLFLLYTFLPFHIFNLSFSSLSFFPVIVCSSLFSFMSFISSMAPCQCQ